MSSTPLMRVIANCTRALIRAPEGRKLVQADLSNIEGRVAAWLAGEQWKLDAFRAFDAGEGEDLYKLSYAKSFVVSPGSVTKDQRQIGKVQELMLQYEGGVGAFKTGAATYKIDLDALAKSAWPAMPDDMRAQAQIMLHWHRERGRNPPKLAGLSESTWLACEGLKLGWRAAHPRIKGIWRELRDGYADLALGISDHVRIGPLLSMTLRGTWLVIHLPSKRTLCYPFPKVGRERVPCPECEGTGALDGMECPACEGSGVQETGSDRLSYMGVDSYTRKWSKQYTYGGSLFENIVQAVARDVLARAMPRVEAAGYPIILTVHDEVVCETPDAPQFNPTHLASLLSVGESWTKGLPLAAAGFEAPSYRKE